MAIVDTADSDLCHLLSQVQIPVFMSFFFAIQRIAADGLAGFTPEQIGFTTGEFQYGTGVIRFSNACLSVNTLGLG